MPSPSLLAMAEEAIDKGPIDPSERRALGETPSRPDEIRELCYDIGEFLAAKNEQYGDSALDPVRIFSRADPVEQLLVRIDDKLSRLARGDDRIEPDADVVDDLIGYLVLLKLARRSK